MKNRVAKAPYRQLLRQIKQEIKTGLYRAQAAYNREKVITYWKIGKAISAYIDKTQILAAGLLRDLSQDLEIGERLLYQMLKFYRAYPKLTAKQILPWSHYKVLSTIEQEPQRRLLEQKALEEKMSKRALESLIKQEREKQLLQIKKSPPKRLTRYKGRLYTYTTFKTPNNKNLLIDCGFNIYYETGQTKTNSKILESRKTEDGYKIIKSNASPKQLYTYKSYVEKVIDGDTIWLIIDCGFKIWTRQKVRLRAIDAPPLTTSKGIEAYKFVESQLKALPFIIIKSHGRDKYARYLVDLYYSKGTDDPYKIMQNGQFLNQILLDKGLAERE